MVAIIIFSISALIAGYFFNAGDRYDAPHPFSCGSDEICYCDKSKDCKKK
jgi:hypothetical protein